MWLLDHASNSSTIQVFKIVDFYLFTQGSYVRLERPCRIGYSSQKNKLGQKCVARGRVFGGMLRNL